MATANTPGTPAHICNLFQLHAVIQLCAWAAEAHSILDATGEACLIDPKLHERLSRLVPASLNWDEIDFPLGQVLDNAARQLNDMIGEATA